MAIVVVLGWSGLPAAAETVEFTISDNRITESSGLATDADAERYWTINDSGDEGIAYALDGKGKTDGTLEFRADPVDVEAVAFHDGRLYLADIGDNRERRDLVTVYVFADAEPAADPVIFQAYDFAYPDGPHDAETLLVDGDGRLFLVTKGVDGGIYAAPSSPSRTAVNELERVGDAPAFVTDGTVLPDGRYALRTYVSVEVIDADSLEVVARVATPAQRQGESITTTFDGKALLIGSEGEDSAVLRIDIPPGMGEAPSSAATPPPEEDGPPQGNDTTASSGDASGEPSGEASEAEEPAGSDPAVIGRPGTLAALGIAAVVAVVAGAVVGLVRRS